MIHDLNQLLSQANDLREQKKYVESNNLAQQIFDNSQSDTHLKVHALLCQSVTARLTNDFSKAKELISTALNLQPLPDDLHYIYFEQATILENEGNFASASQSYYEAASSLPNSINSLGLNYRYLEHAAWASAKSGDLGAVNKLRESILKLEENLNSPEIIQDVSEFGQKYKLQVWLSKAYMHLYGLGDRSVSVKLDSLLSSNPNLKIRQEQWEEIKKAN